ncbi:uncharacterized protein LOC131947850 [Physella acuta]|uniref:uncharacterized protein LOC131947850 n=1 Tax=Physella acuta TaxID=109671 RepID=UPI0027DE0E87|nr:uncharacterized protein LOC131947850 [Physella acuta]
MDQRIFLLFTIITLSTAEVQTGCVWPETIQSDGNCFKHFTTIFPWPSAKAKCQSYGGVMASIRTTNQMSQVAQSSAGVYDYIWIGASSTDDVWRWVETGLGVNELPITQQTAGPKTSSACAVMSTKNLALYEMECSEKFTYLCMEKGADSLNAIISTTAANTTTTRTTPTIITPSMTPNYPITPQSKSSTVKNMTPSTTQSTTSPTQSISGTTTSPTQSISGTTTSPTQSISGTTTSPTQSISGTTTSPTQSISGTTTSPTQSISGTTTSPTQSISGTEANTLKTAIAKSPEVTTILNVLSTRFTAASYTSIQATTSTNGAVWYESTQAETSTDESTQAETSTENNFSPLIPHDFTLITFTLIGFML